MARSRGPLPPRASIPGHQDGDRARVRLGAGDSAPRGGRGRRWRRRGRASQVRARLADHVVVGRRILCPAVAFCGNLSSRSDLGICSAAMTCRQPRLSTSRTAPRRICAGWRVRMPPGHQRIQTNLARVGGEPGIPGQAAHRAGHPERCGSLEGWVAEHEPAELHPSHRGRSRDSMGHMIQAQRGPQTAPRAHRHRYHRDRRSGCLRGARLAGRPGRVSRQDRRCPVRGRGGGGPCHSVGRAPVTTEPGICLSVAHALSKLAWILAAWTNA